ncbi:unnamed protein product [Vicia faba]|uniref:Uncharacterized protein n=1 Tax=Vicia faba TaxID=3906 RepID=A0AAV0Z8X5_VICFA|nr:unnamed protein product [Vicia faba]
MSIGNKISGASPRLLPRSSVAILLQPNISPHDLRRRLINQRLRLLFFLCVCFSVIHLYRRGSSLSSPPSSFNFRPPSSILRHPHLRQIRFKTSIDLLLTMVQLRSISICSSCLRFCTQSQPQHIISSIVQKNNMATLYAKGKD